MKLRYVSFNFITIYYYICIEILGIFDILVFHDPFIFIFKFFKHFYCLVKLFT